ncbi:Telomerase activating protein Est1 [Balamuthia mandrillaris]
MEEGRGHFAPHPLAVSDSTVTSTSALPGDSEAAEGGISTAGAFERERPFKQVPSSKDEANARMLYRKIVSLEKELRALLKKQNKPLQQAAVQLRSSIQKHYEEVLFLDHEFALSKDIEQGLWKTVFYKVIEDYRLHIRKYSAAITKKGLAPESSLGQQLHKYCTDFKKFLKIASDFYVGLIRKFQQHFGIALDGSVIYSSSERPSILRAGEKVSISKDKRYISCHRCLIFLGDIARYHKDLIGDEAQKDWQKAEVFYQQAFRLVPENGNPHNQMAVLATYVDDELNAVYRYFRSLAVRNPFVTARDNLVVLFEKNRQKAQMLTAADNAKPKPSPKKRTRRPYVSFLVVLVFFSCVLLISIDAKLSFNSGGRRINEPRVEERNVELSAFFTRFVRLHGILFTKISLETFDDIQQEVLQDLEALLRAGRLGEDQLLKLLLIIIFVIHNTAWSEPTSATTANNNTSTSSITLSSHSPSPRAASRRSCYAQLVRAEEARSAEAQSCALRFLLLVMLRVLSVLQPSIEVVSSSSETAKQASQPLLSSQSNNDNKAKSKTPNSTERIKRSQRQLLTLSLPILLFCDWFQAHASELDAFHHPTSATTAAATNTANNSSPSSSWQQQQQLVELWEKIWNALAPLLSFIAQYFEIPSLSSIPSRLEGKALWEEIEVRGFLPLMSASSITKETKVTSSPQRQASYDSNTPAKTSQTALLEAEKEYYMNQRFIKLLHFGKWTTLVAPPEQVTLHYDLESSQFSRQHVTASQLQNGTNMNEENEDAGKKQEEQDEDEEEAVEDEVILFKPHPEFTPPGVMLEDKESEEEESESEEEGFSEEEEGILSDGSKQAPPTKSPSLLDQEEEEEEEEDTTGYNNLDKYLNNLIDEEPMPKPQVGATEQEEKNDAIDEQTKLSPSSMWMDQNDQRMARPLGPTSPTSKAIGSEKQSGEQQESYSPFFSMHYRPISLGGLYNRQQFPSQESVERSKAMMQQEKQQPQLPQSNAAAFYSSFASSPLNPWAAPSSSTAFPSSPFASSTPNNAVSFVGGRITAEQLEGEEDELSRKLRAQSLLSSRPPPPGFSSVVPTSSSAAVVAPSSPTSSSTASFNAQQASASAKRNLAPPPGLEAFVSNQSTPPRSPSPSSLSPSHLQQQQQHRQEMFGGWWTHNNGSDVAAPHLPLPPPPSLLPHQQSPFMDYFHSNNSNSMNAGHHQAFLSSSSSSTQMSQQPQQQQQRDKMLNDYLRSATNFFV